LVSRLEALTNKNFAASTDRTGAACLEEDAQNDQGDFLLETDGIDVTRVYFCPERLSAWKHQLFVGALVHGCSAVGYALHGDWKKAKTSAGKAASSAVVSMLTGGLGDFF
jgi:hypothetical protein